MLVSHCSNSPRQLRRCLQVWTCFSFRGLAVQFPARINSCRRLSRLSFSPCSRSRYSLASVGPKSAYSRSTNFTTRLAFPADMRRPDALPRNPWITPPSPRSRNRFSSFRNPRSLIPNCPAACCCTRCPCFTSCSTFNRSRSRCPIFKSSSVSATLHWLTLLGTFYFALLGTSHVAVTRLPAAPQAAWSLKTLVALEALADGLCTMQL